MSRPLRVFLCHASQDKPAVYELYKRLKTEEWIEPWLDKVSILPGKNWQFVIEKAVEDSDVAVICLSNQAVSKEGFVQREFKYAYDIALEKPDGTIYLIPLLLDDCSVPRGLRSFQYVNYYGTDQNNAYFDLLRSLKERHEQIVRQEAEELERKHIEEETRREVEKTIRERAIAKAVREQEEKEKLQWEITQRKIQEEQERKLEKTAKNEARKKKRQEFVANILNFALLNSRWLGVGGIILFALVFSGFALNYLIKNMSFTFSPALNPSLWIGSTTISEKDGMTLLYIPSGEFTMGSDDGAPDVQPIHRVFLFPFWIDQTEVTNEMYSMYIKAGKCDPPSASDFIGYPSYANHPVVYVDWSNANAYCSWANRRLPSEAEWEKAARGTDERMFPWGDAFPDSNLLNYDGNVSDTTEVEKYPGGRSFYGVYDMAGNVWEWVSDKYSPTYYQTSPSSNPLGPDSGQFGVLRGGSWRNGQSDVRSTTRYRIDPTVKSFDIGFRCALSP